MRPVTAKYIESAFCRVITPENSSQLYRQGFFVAKNAIPRDLAVDLRNEMRELHYGKGSHFGLEEGRSAFNGETHTGRSVFIPNSTHFVSRDGFTSTLVKRGIFEFSTQSRDLVWLPSTLGALASDKTVATLLNTYFVPFMKSPGARFGAQSLKLQINDGTGGRFPIHFDSDAKTDARRVSICVYLNEDCDENRGGELVLYPFLSHDKIVIKPTLGTVVFFDSRYMPHATLSSSFERYMFTIWLHGNEKMAASSSVLQAKCTATNADEKELQRLMEPEMRKHFIKFALSKEWAESIVEAHPDNEDRKRALKAHWEDVDVIGRVFGKALPNGLKLLNDKMVQGSMKAYPMRWFS